MVRNAIYKSQSVAVHSVSSGPGLERANVVSIVDSPEFSGIGKLNLDEMHREGIACARGVGSAFLVEAGMALLGCAIWLVWQFAH
jgi:hypothetical protein